MGRVCNYKQQTSNHKLQLHWGRIGFDSICFGWYKHAVRWVIST